MSRQLGERASRTVTHTMIRFSYECPPGGDLPCRRLSIEGDNERGYLLLGWDDGATAGAISNAVRIRTWFETLGQALDHCRDVYFIAREDWVAPNVKPPTTSFSGRERGRNRRDSRRLRPESPA